MAYDDLRVWVVKWSFGCAFLTFAVFLLLPVVLPALGQGMTWDQAWKLAQISLPVFMGYLASAAAFASGQTVTDGDTSAKATPLLILLTKWSFFAYLIAFVLLLGVYLYTQHPSRGYGNGMSPETLATGMAIALGFLTATTNALILKLFGRK